MAPADSDIDAADGNDAAEYAANFRDTASRLGDYLAAPLKVMAGSMDEFKQIATYGGTVNSADFKVSAGEVAATCGF